MHECKGMAKIKLTIKFPISGQFNSNYKSGIEVLEDAAVEGLLTFLPQDFKVEIEDVEISGYEHTTQEREVEND